MNYERNKCTDFQAFRLFLGGYMLNEYRKIIEGSDYIYWWIRSIADWQYMLVGAFGGCGSKEASELLGVRPSVSI